MMVENNQVTVRSIDIFPLKSFSAHSVQSANVLPCGALEQDRRWALFNEQGGYINGKKTPLLHGIQTRFNSDFTRIEVTMSNQSCSFELPDQIEMLEQLLMNHLGYSVSIRENRQQGFPDDLDSPGPTLIGSASLELMTRWFPGLTVSELKKRFRANILLETSEPFWEDRLFGPPGSPRRFRIGDVELLGVNPCQRCVVPSRDPLTGESWPDFQKEFARLREQSLPESTAKEHFNHYYRFAVNTRISPENKGKAIRCGDVLELL